MKNIYLLLAILTAFTASSQVVIVNGGTPIGNTDSQQLSLQGTLLQLENSASVNLSVLGGATLEALTQAEFDLLTAPQQAAYTGIIVDDAGNPSNVFSEILLLGSTSGQVTITAPAVAGTPTLTLPTSNLDIDTFITEVNANTAKLGVDNDVVQEKDLKAVNAPTDEYVLTYESTTGDFEWEAAPGGGDIYKHPDSPIAVDSLYVGTVAQIAAAGLGGTTLAFPTDASNNLDDLDDVNTATVTNRNVLVADGVDFESRALVALDVSDLATSTTTFTNKRITRRVNTIASSATPTPAGDTTDMFTVTALAAAATFAAPTGTPTDGQSLVIRIKDNATARTLAWNAIYRAGSDFALPTTTVISETIYLQFVYNSADSKWDAVGLTQGF